MTGTLLIGIYAFVLSVFLGFELINKVPSILHTPLMSGSNAISGVTILGALTCVNSTSHIANLLGLIAIALAMINVVGGFLVTDRMLKMFRR